MDGSLMTSLKAGSYQLEKVGLAYHTRLRKTRGSVFFVIPRHGSDGLMLRKGDTIQSHLVKHAEKWGLWVEFG